MIPVRGIETITFNLSTTIIYCFQFNDSRSRDWNELRTRSLPVVFDFQFNDSRSRDWNLTYQSISPKGLRLSIQWFPFAGLKRKLSIPTIDGGFFQFNDSRSRDWNNHQLLTVPLIMMLSIQWFPFAGLKHMLGLTHKALPNSAFNSMIPVRGIETGSFGARKS